jgi:polysaccharide export outer membrane protein
MTRQIAALIAALLLALPALAPEARAQDSYLLRPGDVVRVEVVEDPSINRSTIVLPDGRISVPLAGTVRAGGRTIEQIQAELSSRLAPNFAAAPTVFVALERLAERAATGVRPITVHVIGEAARPGKLALDRGTTLLQAFAEMGGFSRFAATGRIQLRRPDGQGGETIYPIDYKAIERGASSAGLTVLREGDVIIVPQRRLFE